jgi:hypothetical protein
VRRGTDGDELRRCALLEVIVRMVAVMLVCALFAAGCSKEGPTTTQASPPGSSTSLSGTAAGVVSLQEEGQGLRGQARISDDDARAIALQRVPGGQIIEAELEEEGGRLLYSYEVRAGGGRGTVEVEIDARTGAVVSEEREGDDDEDGPSDREDDDRTR